MLKTPELAMPRTRKVTTVCNGRREVWTNYEEAKSYFLELMMSTEGDERDRAECVYIQLMHGLDECSDEDKYSKKALQKCRAFCYALRRTEKFPQSRLSLRSEKLPPEKKRPEKCL